eukprot:snap_masked-scaffold_23-processed-gene-4.22-mRNA-1 protein AED:1.00 eAED:1.00 QI:0/0/0/0/1/1/2/0/81
MFFNIFIEIESCSYLKVCVFLCLHGTYVHWFKRSNHNADALSLKSEKINSQPANISSKFWEIAMDILSVFLLSATDSDSQY